MNDRTIAGTIRIGSTEQPVTCGVQAPNREALQQWQVVDGAPYLRIALDCGNVREYRTRDEVPSRSIECKCGEIEDEHWFVRYTEQE